MPPHPRYGPFVAVFTPFALLLAAANLYAEAAPDVTFARVAATALLTAAFAGPAAALFFLFDLDAAPPRVFRYWQLLWAFGFVAYALHAYLAVDDWFGWDFAQIAARQTHAVAASNYLLLAVWAADVAVAVTRGQRGGGTAVRLLRWAAHLLFVAAFVVAGVVFRSEAKSTAAVVLGVAVGGAAGFALVCRVLWGGATAVGPPAGHPSVTPARVR